jgi:uncharacterized protein YjbI with pentapeptide repeats
VWYVTFYNLGLGISYTDLAGMDCQSSDYDASGFTEIDEMMDDFNTDTTEWCEGTKSEALLMVIIGYAGAGFFFWKANNLPTDESQSSKETAKAKAAERSAKLKKAAEEKQRLQRQEVERRIADEEARRAKAAIKRSEISTKQKILTVGIAILVTLVIYYIGPTPIDYRYADLSGQDLSGQDFSGKDMLRANLSGAKLCGDRLPDDSGYSSPADFSGANLQGADLSNTALRCGYNEENDVILTNANLAFADLTSTSLPRDLTGVNLSFADLSYAVIYGGNHPDTNFFGVKWYYTGCGGFPQNSGETGSCVY